MMGYAKKKTNQPDGGGHAGSAYRQVGRMATPGNGGDGANKRRIIVWGAAIVAVVVAIVAFIAAKHDLIDKRQSLPEMNDKPRHIAKEHTKSSTTQKVKESEQPKAEKPVRITDKGTVIPDNVQPDGKGVLRYPGGLRWVDTNDLHKVEHPRKKRLFKHHSENSIATILTLDPDLMAPFLVGRRPKFGKRFVDDFKASLLAPPETHDDDTDDERELRKMVLDVKKEMAEAMNRGADIAQMMNEAQDELDRLVNFKDTLMKQLKEIRLDSSYTDQDIADFTSAANEMLKSQGLKELKMPNLTYRQLMLQKRRERGLDKPKERNNKK